MDEAQPSMRHILQVANKGVRMGVLITQAERLEEKRKAEDGERTPWAQRLGDELKNRADEQQLAKR